MTNARNQINLLGRRRCAQLSEKKHVWNLKSNYR